MHTLLVIDSLKLIFSFSQDTLILNNSMPALRLNVLLFRNSMLPELLLLQIPRKGFSEKRVTEFLISLFGHNLL